MKKSSSGCSSLICSKAAPVVALFILFVFAFSCASALYIPSAGHETASASLSDLTSGRKLYINKCGSCHNLILPEKYTKREWQYWVDKMAPKAPMDSIEKDHIMKYLTRGL